MSRVEPNRNIYVGHRYVPKIFGEWDNQNEYEGLSIVTHQGASYTSKKRVPVGIDILNDEFWVVTGNYNAQVEEYRKETERVAKDLLLKSDKTYVDTELGKKSDKTYVDTELGKKSDLSYVDTELGKKSDKTYVDTELDKKSDVTYVDNELDKKTGLYAEDLIFNIPSDFNDFESAIKHINRNHLTINTNITINIEQGHRPKLSVQLNGGSSKNITLTSDSDVVYLSDVLTDSSTLFDLYEHDGFTLDCLIDMEGKGNHGIFLAERSYIKVASGKGIMNAGNCGLYARSGSTAYAQNSIFTGASAIASNAGAGITSWGATVNASYADVSNSGYYGARAAHGGILDFDDGKANNVGRHAIRAAQGGIVTCRNSEARNAGVHGIYAIDSSSINARETDVSGAGDTGYFANSGSIINAYAGNASECNTGVLATENSNINFRGGKANDCIDTKIRVVGSSSVEAQNLQALGASLYGLYVDHGSSLSCQTANIRGSRDSNLRVQNGSRVNARFSTIRDTPNTNTSAHNVVVQNGSQVNLQNSTVVYSGGHDLYVYDGGIITAVGCRTTNSLPDTDKVNVEDTSVNTLNTLSVRGYIIG